MKKRKSLLSIILIAILGTLVVSCNGSDKPDVITGVTLSGSWIATLTKAMPSNTFTIEGEETSVQADKMCLHFVPATKFTPSGKGTYLVEYPYGPLARKYRTFTWELDKSNPNNTITKIVFDDNGETMNLYATSISPDQFSYSKTEDGLDPIPYDLCNSVDWNQYQKSGEDTREYDEWVKAYKNWKSNSMSAVTLTDSWITTDVKALPSNTFDYKGNKATVMASKKCFSFTPYAENPNEGSGIELVTYSYGPTEKAYRTFKWKLDKTDINNIITNITYNDNGEKATYYKTSISAKQISFSLSSDASDKVSFDPWTAADWSSTTNVSRTEWEEAYEAWLSTSGQNNN